MVQGLPWHMKIASGATKQSRQLPRDRRVAPIAAGLLATTTGGGEIVAARWWRS
jgi:hypothetical protein